MTTLLILTLLSTGEPTAAPTRDAEGVWPAAHRIDAAAPASDLPAPTTTDEQKSKAANAALERLEGEERSWTAQLVRTILSLLLVVGLIYLVFKVVVPRLLGVSLPTRTGKSLPVVERTQLDARHAVVLLEIEGKQRFLVATGERGVQLLADLSAPHAAKEGRADFRALLERAGATVPAADKESDG